MPLPTPEDLPDPEMGPGSLVSPALVGGFFTTAPSGRPPEQLLLLLSRFSHVRLCATPVPEILQARTLEWVAISFSNA